MFDMFLKNQLFEKGECANIKKIFFYKYYKTNNSQNTF